jgi:hypothetical protein
MNHIFHSLLSINFIQGPESEVNSTNDVFGFKFEIRVASDVFIKANCDLCFDKILRFPKYPSLTPGTSFVDVNNIIFGV